MTCRHKKGDPNCSSSPEGRYRAHQEAEAYKRESAQRKVDELLARTPNPEKYDILRIEQVKGHLVAEVQYSSCTNCSFDAKKVMVFLDTPMKAAVMWKTIDPHFSDKPILSKKIAPAPRARFPADKQGWEDAMNYAKGK